MKYSGSVRPVGKGRTGTAGVTVVSGMASVAMMADGNASGGGAFGAHFLHLLSIREQQSLCFVI